MIERPAARVWDAKTGRNTDWIRDELNQWERNGFTLHSIVPWGNGDVLMVASKIIPHAHTWKCDDLVWLCSCGARSTRPPQEAQEDQRK